jgi:hypothetical protein
MTTFQPSRSQPVERWLSASLTAIPNGRDSLAPRRLATDALADGIEAKPIRTRRRWLIVAFVLMFASLVTWWNWPRGDARFVGKWSVAETVIKGHSNFFFFRNGTAYVQEPNGSFSFPLSWQVEADHLSYGSSGAGLLNGLVPWVQWLSGRRILRKQHWTIVSVKANEIIVRHTPLDLEMRLRRE